MCTDLHAPIDHAPTAIAFDRQPPSAGTLNVTPDTGILGTTTYTLVANGFVYVAISARPTRRIHAHARGIRTASLITASRFVRACTQGRQPALQLYGRSGLRRSGLSAAADAAEHAVCGD